jgi:hypothetical protein
VIGSLEKGSMATLGAALGGKTPDGGGGSQNVGGGDSSSGRAGSVAVTSLMDLISADPVPPGSAKKPPSLGNLSLPMDTGSPARVSSPPSRVSALGQRRKKVC